MNNMSSFEKAHSEAIPRIEAEPFKWIWAVDFTEPGNQEEIKLTIEKIKEKIANPENFLGKGGAGKAYDLGDQCLKLVKNRHNSPNLHHYNLGNSIKEEYDIQKILNNFTENDVYSPTAIGYYEGHETNGLVMEKLDAANLQLVINGSETMPASFDLEDFFWRLEGYISEMHSVHRIAHLDLEARNIMIDRTTGRPRVIDFGRSKKFAENDETFERMAQKDFDDINDAYIAMKARLDKKRNM